MKEKKEETKNPTQLEKLTFANILLAITKRVKDKKSITLFELL